MLKVMKQDSQYSLVAISENIFGLDLVIKNHHDLHFLRKKKEKFK